MNLLDESDSLPERTNEEDASLSLIIPIYNERDAIRSTIDEVVAFMDKIDIFEIIVVDDGSTDGSSEILDEVVSQQPQVRLKRHARNSGYGAALKTGVRAARGTYLAITDADSTYPNERIRDLLRICMEDDADMVVGARTGANVTYSTLRKIPKYFMRRFCQWITQREIPDMNSGLRVFKTKSLQRFLNYLPNGFSFTTTITIAMMTNNLNVIYEPIDYAERTGNSKIKPIQDTINFFQLIARTGLYFAPFRVFGPVIALAWLTTAIVFIYDISNFNISDKSVLLLGFSFNLTVITALADMIDKRLR